MRNVKPLKSHCALLTKPGHAVWRERALSLQSFSDRSYPSLSLVTVLCRWRIPHTKKVLPCWPMVRYCTDPGSKPSSLSPSILVIFLCLFLASSPKYPQHDELREHKFVLAGEQNVRQSSGQVWRYGKWPCDKVLSLYPEINRSLGRVFSQRET